MYKDFLKLSNYLAQKSGYPNTGRDPQTARYESVRDFLNFLVVDRSALVSGSLNTGIEWQHEYDLDPKVFENMIEKLWLEIKPFYELLHGYVRHKLRSRPSSHSKPSAEVVQAEHSGSQRTKKGRLNGFKFEIW